MCLTLNEMLFCSTGADGRGERGEDGLHEDGAHIRVRSVSSVEPIGGSVLQFEQSP